jgi:hypothetical protein
MANRCAEVGVAALEAGKDVLLEKPLAGEEARKRIVVCLGAEQSLREGREVALGF